MLKVKFVRSCIALGLLACCAAPVLAAGISPRVPASSSSQRRAKQTPPVVCPDPTIPCRTAYDFKPHQLPFRTPKNVVIFETEWFYAIILKSVRNTNDDCNVFIPEAERIEAQKLFPHHKVFASRCYDPEELSYANTTSEQKFMAVFAGRTRAEAAQMLEQVKATGKFPGANLRRTRAGFNGT